MESERTAAEVFGLLSDEIRLDILRTIARAQHERKRTGVADLSFSDIYDRVDVDGTSKLSYHLGELTGTFIRKHDDGYAFTHAGEQLVRFILAGNYQQPSGIGTIETDGTCLRCGESGLRATLHDQYFLLRCQACDQPTFSYKVTPAQVAAYDGAALIDALTWELTGDLLKMRQGVCPECAGRLDTSVLATGETPVDEPVPADFVTMSECEQCLRFLSLPLTHAAAFHPASVAFHWERGIDILGTGLWEFHARLHEGAWSAEQVGTEPGTYRVELRRDNASVRLYLDESATVTRTERLQRRDQSDRGA